MRIIHFSLVLASVLLLSACDTLIIDDGDSGYHGHSGSDYGRHFHGYTGVPATPAPVYRNTGVPASGGYEGHSSRGYGDTGVPANVPRTYRDTGVPASAPGSYGNTGVPASNQAYAPADQGSGGYR